MTTKVAVDFPEQFCIPVGYLELLQNIFIWKILSINHWKYPIKCAWKKVMLFFLSTCSDSSTINTFLKCHLRLRSSAINILFQPCELFFQPHMHIIEWMTHKLCNIIIRLDRRLQYLSDENIFRKYLRCLNFVKANTDQEIIRSPEHLSVDIACLMATIKCIRVLVHNLNRFPTTYTLIKSQHFILMDTKE